MAGTPFHSPNDFAELEPAVLAPGHTFASVTDKISSIVLNRPASRGWWFGLAVSFSLVMLLLTTVTYLLVVGVGIWGINIPIAWGFAIVNFVWWIGIGHAGTLISAILLLLHQEWRTSINRFAEAMTLFAVACAGVFPLLHMGRPWFFYWLLAVSEHDESLAAISQPARVGLLCCLHVLYGLTTVLVRRPDTRHGDAARQFAQPLRPNRVRRFGDGLARFRPSLAAA